MNHVSWGASIRAGEVPLATGHHASIAAGPAMIALTATTAMGLLAGSPFAPAVLAPAPRVGPLVRMQDSEWDKYLKSRGTADVEAAEAEYRKFKGIDQEFDGGDSGGGVVGDGNTDLEDQRTSQKPRDPPSRTLSMIGSRCPLPSTRQA